MEVIRQGSRGPAVEALQKFLGPIYQLKVDGIFGPRTYEALKDWQRDHGLTADGIAGPATWGKIQADPWWAQSQKVAGPAPPSSTDVADEFKGLGAIDTESYLSRKRRLELEVSLASEDILRRADLTEAEKHNSLKDLDDLHKRAIYNLNASTAISVRGLRERVQKQLEKAPDTYAARGLYRSGVMLNKLSEMEEGRDRQIRDTEARRQMQESNYGFQTNLNKGKVTRQAGNIQSMLQLQAAQLKKRLEAGIIDLDSERRAAQSAVSEQLNLLK